MVTKVVSMYPTKSRAVARKLLFECFNLIDSEIDSDLVEDVSKKIKEIDTCTLYRG